MNYLIILRTLSICINMYLFLLFIRILFTWFSPSVDGKLWHYLCLITGPYLALFKGIKFLRRGKFDFTPILAISLLAFCNQIIVQIRMYLEQANSFSVWILLALILLSIWNIISFILIFFGILCVIRLVSIVFHLNKSHTILKVIDLAIQPLISVVMRIIPRKMDYVQLLFLNFLFLTAIWFLGKIIIEYIAVSLQSIPV